VAQIDVSHHVQDDWTFSRWHNSKLVAGDDSSGSESIENLCYDLPLINMEITSNCIAMYIGICTPFYRTHTPDSATDTSAAANTAISKCK
jgi:hypothetical protein